ncbi:MAG: hypothetical protein ACLFSN_04275 [Candidatus Woesearchaeota archaeon]
MTFFMQGALSFANILISIFVLVFAISFLKKTVKRKDRNPWIFLLIAVIVFFFMQVTKVFDLLGYINISGYSFYMDSMFIAIILFTFIFQYNLILNSELIEIRKKQTKKATIKMNKAKE